MRLWGSILFLLAAALAPAHAQDMQRALVVSSCGAQALAPGPLTNLFMNPAGQLCLTGLSGITPPANTAAPVASGSTVNGSLLSTTDGTWTGSPTFTYQWQRNAVNIAGATANTYTTVTADGGTAVGAQVTGTNAGGSASALSNTLSIASAAPNVVTPLSVSQANSLPSPTVTNYAPFGASQGWGTTVSGKQIVSPIAGTMAGLEVINNAAVTGGTYQIAVNVNGATPGSPGSLTCSFGISAGTNYGTTSSCNDLLDSIPINVGDLISVQSTIIGTPTTLGASVFKITALFTSTNSSEGIILLADGGPSATALSFAGPSSAISFATTDALASWVMPAPGTLNDLYAQLSVAAGASKSWTFTVLKNGSNAGVVAGDATHCGGASSLACTDLINSVSVAALDLISVQACPSAVSPLAGPNCPTGTGAPTAANVGISMRFAPTTPGQGLVLINVPPTNAVSYFSGLTGNISGSTSELNAQIPTPGIAGHLTFGNLTVGLCPDLGATFIRTVNPRVSLANPVGTPALPTVALTGGGGNACPTLLSGRDAADTFQATTGQMINYKNAVNAGSSTTPTEFKASMTVTQ